MSTTATESTFDRLARLRAELAQTETDLAEATARRDASECVRLSNHARVLKDFIAEDAEQATIETEQLNREDAGSLVAELSEQYRANVALIDGATEDARAIIREATEAVGAVCQEYNRLQWIFRALELLRLRYPDLDGARVAPPPPPPNVAVALFAAEGRAIETVPRPILSLTASMTEEQKIQEGYNGLEEFLTGHSIRLPAEVAKFFERAGARPRV